jgi:hypothetical protein
VYEEFALTHCNGRVNPPAVCAEAEETAQDLRHTLELMSKSTVRQHSDPAEMPASVFVELQQHVVSVVFWWG